MSDSKSVKMHYDVAGDDFDRNKEIEKQKIHTDADAPCPAVVCRQGRGANRCRESHRRRAMPQEPPRAARWPS